MAEGQKNQEKELLRQLANGNLVAFHEIYYTYSPKLFNNLLKLVKIEAIAQEILQDVFLKVWENHKTIDPDKSFRSYLYTIAENKAFDFFRKAAHDKKLQASLIALASVGHEQIESELFSKENHHILEIAINTLPPQRQLVFRLSKIDDLSYEEISKKLGISTSTISDHIVKATKSIRNFFQKHPELLILLFAFRSI
jgi:RNA polymerase sigma-70 factor (ECF subfamily)